MRIFYKIVSEVVRWALEGVAGEVARGWLLVH